MFDKWIYLCFLGPSLQLYQSAQTFVLCRFLLGFLRNRKESPKGLSLELGFSAVQSDWWIKHALENWGEIALYPSASFQNILPAFKEGQTLSAACGSADWLLNPLWSAGWNPWLSVSMKHLSASPSEAKVKYQDLLVAKFLGLHAWNRR